MKQLSSFAVTDIDNECKFSYTYDVIDDDTGNPVSQNNQGSFTVLDADLLKLIEKVRAYVKDNRISPLDVLKMMIVSGVGGGDRLTYVYDKVKESGDIEKTDQKGRFYAVNAELSKNIGLIKKYIMANRLEVE